ncbi:MAG: hypothetical protein ACE5E4_10725 [Candidatus Binatia bacterium]
MPSENKHLVLASLAAALALLTLQNAVAGESRSIAVVAHANNEAESLAPYFVRKIFTGEQTQWPNGSRIQVLDYKAGAAVRSAFYRSLLGSRGARAHPRGQPTVFRPLEHESVGTILKLLRIMPNAVAYVWADEVPEGIKVVATIEVDR